MSGANSAPVFEQRARELGIPEGLLDTLKNAHVNTFARLAYLTPYQPGQPDDSVLFDKLEEIATRPLADFEKACFRQLFYEASAITVSELKQKVERVDSSEPATLPLAERMHRLQNQRNTLSGVHFSVFTEPSNKLVDQYFQMMTDQQLVWLPWSKLASRSDELQLNKKDLQLTFDANGNLKMSKKELEAQSDLKGEIQVRQALRRRSLAVDLTGLIDFQVQETWHEKMFECLAKQAPSGYKQTSMEQCKEADKMLWTMLAERTRGNVRVALAAKPVQDAFEALSASTEVLLLLQPLPAPHSRPGPETLQTLPVMTNSKRREKGRVEVALRYLISVVQKHLRENLSVLISTMDVVRGLNRANVVIVVFMYVSDALATSRTTSAHMITDKLQTTESGHQQLWTMVATPRLALLQQNVGATIQFQLHAATLTIKKVVQAV